MLQLFTDMNDPISGEKFKLLVLGLTELNIKKLIGEGAPIHVEFKKPVDALLVVYGENKPAILDKLKLYGYPIDDYMVKAAQEHPE